MVKTNDGLLTIGLLVVVVALGEIDWKWATVVAGVPLVAVFLLGWLAAGQSVTNIASYVRGSLSVAVGYSSAMQVTAGRSAEDWYALLVSALLVLLFALSVRGKPGRYQVGGMLVLAGWLWAALKEGFVRHDDHDLTFFGLALAAVLLARLKRPLRAASRPAFLPSRPWFSVSQPASCPSSSTHPCATTSAFFQDVGEVLGFGRLGQAQQADRGQFVTSGDALRRPHLVSAGGPQRGRRAGGELDRVRLPTARLGPRAGPAGI